MYKLFIYLSLAHDKTKKVGVITTATFSKLLTQTFENRDVVLPHLFIEPNGSTKSLLCQRRDLGRNVKASKFLRLFKFGSRNEQTQKKDCAVTAESFSKLLTQTFENRDVVLPHRFFEPTGETKSLLSQRRDLGRNVKASKFLRLFKFVLRQNKKGRRFTTATFSKLLTQT